MKHISTTTIPNPLENTYWIDLKENPYGGIVKYYDWDKDEWVYLDEPIFQNSPANKLTQHHIDVIQELEYLPDQVKNIQLQIDTLNESKVEYSEIYLKEEVDDIHAESNKKIDELTNSLSTLETSVSNRIDEIVSDTNIVTSELSNAVATKASYVWVDERIKDLTGVAPDALNTLEELAKALGDDPNFAATISEQLGSKLDKTQTIETITEIVPEWSRRSTKPSYIASEVGALPSSTVIPERTTQLTNDAGFLTQLEVNALIQSHKPLTTAQYASINKLDSYVVYNLNEGELNMPTTYGTIVANITSAITTLKVKFESKPTTGNYYVLYVNPVGEMQVEFYTLNGELLHTASINDMQRFDLRVIDLTDYILSTENNEDLLTSYGQTIVANYTDGYIIDYVGGSGGDLTWYEG